MRFCYGRAVPAIIRYVLVPAVIGASLGLVVTFALFLQDSPGRQAGLRVRRAPGCTFGGQHLFVENARTRRLPAAVVSGMV